MGSQELSVSWKDHSSVLIAVFEKLLSNKSLVDCTVAAEGQYLKVHKVVLSACSPYFEVLLNEDIDKHPIIILRDVKFEDLKRIIDFVYRGEVKLPEDQLVEFLNVAESLQIKGLGAGSNEASGKRRFSADLFSKEKTECPSAQKRTRNHLSNSEEKNQESVPSADLASLVEKSQPPWHPPGGALAPNNSASVGTNSVASGFSQSVSNTKLQNDYCTSEVTQSASNPISVSVEPLIPNTRTVVKVELNSDENSEAKDDFGYQTIADDFPESSYILDSGGQGSQPSTSHPYSQLASSHTTSASIVSDDTLGGSQGVETGHTEGFSIAADHFEEEILPDLARGSTGRQFASARHRASAPAFASSPRKRHTGRNMCTVCNAGFVGQASLRRHMRTHTGEKPFRCEVCLTSFRQEPHLKEHMRIHTGEKPYECSLCGVTYRHLKTFKIHWSRHHMA